MREGIATNTASIAPPAPAAVTTKAAGYINPVEGLGVAEAVRYALTHNKGLLADRKLVEEAVGRLKQAGLRANPMLDVSRTSDLSDSSQGEFSVGVSVPLELGGRRARRIEVAERELERRRFEVADRERRLAAEVRAKYGEAVEAARNLELNERLFEINQQSYGLIKARVAEGASAPLEQSLLRVEVGRIEAQRTAFESRVAVLVEELKNLLGLSLEEKLQLRDEFVERPVTLTREQLLETAFKSRPDLQAARTAEAVAAAVLAQAKTEGKVDLSIFAEVGRQSIGFDQLGTNRVSGKQERVFMKDNMLKAGIAITLPLRNRNQGNIEAAIAAADEARLRREFVETVVRREVAAAYARYEGATRVLKTYDTDLLSASQNNLRVVRSSYDLGHVRLTEVLAEQRRLVDVQIGYTGALKEYYAARAELESASGAPLEEK